MKIRELISFIEQLAPPALAESWDNPGLQVGDPDSGLTRLALALNPSLEAIKASVSWKADLLVTHHPLIMTPVKSLSYTQPVARAIALAIQRHLTIYTAHTNLDMASGGVSHALAEKLGISQLTPLKPLTYPQMSYLKLYVPVGYQEKVREAIFQSGGGIIVNYDQCSFETVGMGTFRPGQGAHPFAGRQRIREQVKEVSLEVQIPSHKTEEVLQNIRRVHPYEEMVYVLIPMETPSRKAGLGCVGKLKRDLTLGSLSNKIKKELGL